MDLEARNREEIDEFKEELARETANLPGKIQAAKSNKADQKWVSLILNFPMTAFDEADTDTRLYLQAGSVETRQDPGRWPTLIMITAIKSLEGFNIF